MRAGPARFTIALFGLLAAAPGAATAQTAADSGSVTAFYREWFSSVADAARYASFYAADGVLLPPNGAPVRGREAIGEWLRQSRLNPPFRARPEGIIVDEMRFLTPDWVVYRSTLRGQRTPAGGGETVPFTTKYTDLLHRTAAGGWEVVYRMWSDNH